MGKTKEDLTGFGGFTFVNNSADQDRPDLRAAVKPASVAGQAERVLNIDPTQEPIPHGSEGNSSYEDGLKGGRRDTLLVWVASEAVASSPPKPWYRYTLSVREMSVGIRLTAKKRYDELDMDDGFEVKIQIEKDGTYETDAEATLVFENASLPNF